MIPAEAVTTASVLALSIALIWLMMWDMKNNQRQAREFMQRHGLMEKDDS